MELAALLKTLMQIGSRAYAAIKEADNWQTGRWESFCSQTHTWQKRKVRHQVIDFVGKQAGYLKSIRWAGYQSLWEEHQSRESQRDIRGLRSINGDNNDWSVIIRLWRTENEAAVEKPCTHANQIIPFSDSLSTSLKSVTTAPCHKSLFFFNLYILHIYLLMNVLASLQEWTSHFQRTYLNCILESNVSFLSKKGTNKSQICWLSESLAHFSFVSITEPN